jgi:hypothetical protein
MPEIGVDLTLADIYADVALPEITDVTDDAR